MPQPPQINRWIRLIHIYSAIPVLLSMLFFAITGLLLNHGNWNLGSTQQADLSLTLPSEIQQLDWETPTVANSLSVLSWLDDSHNINAIDIDSEWLDDEGILIVNLTKPGINYSVEVIPEEQVAEVYVRSLPFLEFLNNVHRGKHVTNIWIWLSDLSAICMVIFSLSGFWLVLINAGQRQSAMNWLGVGTGLMVLMIYLMH